MWRCNFPGDFFKKALCLGFVFLALLLCVSSRPAGAIPGSGDRGEKKAPDSFHKKFPLRGDGSLVLTGIHIPVVIKKGVYKGVVIKASGTGAGDLISAEQEGQKVVVRGREKARGTEGQNTVIVTNRSKGQRIIVNGIDVTDKVGGGNPPSVTLEVSEGISGVFSDVDSLNVEPFFEKVAVKGKRSVRAAFKSVGKLEAALAGTSDVTVEELNALDLSLSGVSRLKVNKFGGGRLKAFLSGTSSLRAKGRYKVIEIKSQDATSAFTAGVVDGKFKADSSGASRIFHRGKIKGGVEKNSSGASVIKIEGQEDPAG